MFLEARFIIHIGAGPWVLWAREIIGYLVVSRKLSTTVQSVFARTVLRLANEDGGVS